MNPTGPTKRYYPIAVFALLLALALAGCASYGGVRDHRAEQVTEYLPAPSRPVIIIPGFGNARLYDPVEDQVVWGFIRNLVRTSYSDDLDLPVDGYGTGFGRDRLVPDGTFAGARASFNIEYSLRSALQARGRYVAPETNPESPAVVYPFAYDWRLSATTNARRLAALVDTIRSRWPDDPPKVDLVAHSAGGMIALAYLKLGGLEPERPADEIHAASLDAASKIASVTLISVPQHGTNETVRALARGEKIFRRELPPSMMASFPALLEMLPSDGTVFIDERGELREDLDVWDPGTWETLGFAIFAEHPPSPEERIAFETTLARARALRDLLERPMPPGVRETVITADCLPTAGRILLRADRSLAFYPSELRSTETVLRDRMFLPGDGSVEARSARGESRSEQIFCAGHHAIAGDPDVHRALIAALTARGGHEASEAPTTTRSTGTSSMETPNTR